MEKGYFASLISEKRQNCMMILLLYILPIRHMKTCWPCADGVIIPDKFLERKGCKITFSPKGPRILEDGLIVPATQN